MCDCLCDTWVTLEGHLSDSRVAPEWPLSYSRVASEWLPRRYQVTPEWHQSYFQVTSEHMLERVILNKGWTRLDTPSDNWVMSNYRVTLQWQTSDTWTTANVNPNFPCLSRQCLALVPLRKSRGMQHFHNWTPFSEQLKVICQLRILCVPRIMVAALFWQTHIVWLFGIMKYRVISAALLLRNCVAKAIMVAAN